MTDESPAITRRRLLGSVLTVGVAGAAVGAGTMAAFTDSETSSGNTVSSGTLELTFGGSGTFSFDTSLAPETSTKDSVTLVNDGSITGSVDVDVDYVEHDASGAPDPDMTAQDVAQSLEVTTLTYDNTDITGQIDTSNSPPTLEDLANNKHGTDETTQNDLIDLADPRDGKEFAVELRLKNVGDDYQGDGVDVEFTFYLNQTDGQ